MILTLKNLSISIDGKHARRIVSEFDLALARGQIVALVGQSGSGKSSILNAVAGFLPSRDHSNFSPWDWQDAGSNRLRYSGTISVESKVVDGVPVEKRDTIGFVMQDGHVYDHMTLFDNVAFPLLAKGIRRKCDLRPLVAKLLERVRLTEETTGRKTHDLMNARGRTLSGGERQRVGLARTLAKDPHVFLLDEAFAKLDPLVRGQLFEEFVRLIRTDQRCAVVVTHDMADLAFVDQIALLDEPKTGQGAHRKYIRSGATFVRQGTVVDTDYWRAWDEKIGKVIPAAL